MHLLLRGLVAGGGVVAREAGDPLAEGVAGAEAVVGSVEIGERRPAIPATHIFPGCGQAGALAIRFEQRILIERAIEGVIGVELLAQRPIKQHDVAVAELGKLRRDGGRFETIVMTAS